MIRQQAIHEETSRYVDACAKAANAHDDPAAAADPRRRAQIHAQATGRANLLASFAHTGPADPAPFLIGEVYRFTFQRTPEGWRITSLASAPTWSLTPAAPVTATGAGQ